MSFWSRKKPAAPAPDPVSREPAGNVRLAPSVDQDLSPSQIALLVSRSAPKRTEETPPAARQLAAEPLRPEAPRDGLLAESPAGGEGAALENAPRESAQAQHALLQGQPAEPALNRPLESPRESVTESGAGSGQASAKPGRRPGGVDWWLFVLMIILLGVGLVMVLSASGIVAETSFGDKYHFFKKQLLFALVGGVCLLGAALIPRELLYRSQYFILFGSLLLLLLTLSPLSPAVNGAHRWVRLGPVNIQPMEFAKIALALYLSYFLSVKHDLVKTFTRGVVPPFAVTGLFCFLLLLQPDFGSAMVLASLLFFMCLAGGTRFLYLLVSSLMVVSGGVMLAIFEPYRMRRLTAFLNPFADAQNTGYQLVQSLLAIGSGSFFGVGIGASRQKMFYLPEAHNDFIMAVLAEELGFVGVSCVLGLFLCFFWRCYRIIQGQEDLRDRYTALALTIIMCLGVVLNLAVVMGMAPPKGVPLPFLSYGGSNLVATMICVGLLLNYSRTAKPFR